MTFVTPAGIVGAGLDSSEVMGAVSAGCGERRGERDRGIGTWSRHPAKAG